MRPFSLRRLLPVLGCLGLLLLASGWYFRHRAAGPEDWPGWRGPRGDGTSTEKNVPVKWDVPTGEDVAWKTRIPGEGHSSPIVLGQHLFVTSANTDTQERLLLCLDRDSGGERWRRTVVTPPPAHKQTEDSFASSTPATDGHHVFVAFLDGLKVLVAAYDLEGKQQWLVHPGHFTSPYGFSSSPVIFENEVIINGDQDGNGWIVALSREDGHTLWKIDRENKTYSDCTPLIRQLAGRTQMILAGSKCVASYDPRNGQRHWLIDGPADQFVASMVYNSKHDLLFMSGGAPAHYNLAIKPDGSGNVTKTHIAWRSTKGASYVPSPISEGDYFVVLNDTGIASCFQAGTGDLCWQQRVGPHAHSSPVSANGLVYLTTDDGVSTVVKPGPTYQEVAYNALGESTFSSPAISNGHLFLRGSKHLYCFGPKH
ncbi:MAG: PQQ-binding-like beta-propeller repeat protein [Chthoniobacter sp.]|nr:PQQ-binding-like beta-propeller repeat protein [Chthoniobacter sp.]